MTRKSVAVIGAGVAGLACAARLAAEGYLVDVFERNSEAGGKLGLLQDGGYSWDTGPSLFTQPFLLEQLFADCGCRLKDYFNYRPLGEGTQYFWEDGTNLHAAPDRERLAANVSEAFDTAPEHLMRYLDDAQKLYRHIGSIFLDEPIHRTKTWNLSRVLPALKALKLAYLTRTLHDYNKRQLNHPKLVQLMDRLATYNGSDPYQCPAMLSMIAHLELGEGCWYPDGGMIAIPTALRRLCDSLGVRFHTGATVTRIFSDANRVTGIEVNGERIAADAVVSNSDVLFTYRDLLDDRAMANRIERQERSSSGVVFYWGIAKSFPQLRLHNIFFSDDYAAEFKAIFKAGTLSAEPTVYVNITSKQDAGHAPEGCENWFVLINAPARKAPLTKEEIAAVRVGVLRKLSRLLGENIASLIQCEHVLGPADMERTSGSYLGALYGTASNSAMAAFNRHPNFSRKYPGLFFAGGTVHPGGGIPLCLRSGKLAADAAKAYF